MFTGQVKPGDECSGEPDSSVCMYVCVGGGRVSAGVCNIQGHVQSEQNGRREVEEINLSMWRVRAELGR